MHPPKIFLSATSGDLCTSLLPLKGNEISSTVSL